MWLYLFSLWMKPCVTIQMKAMEPCWRCLFLKILQDEIQYFSLSFELSTLESERVKRPKTYLNLKQCNTKRHTHKTKFWYPFKIFDDHLLHFIQESPWGIDYWTMSWKIMELHYGQISYMQTWGFSSLVRIYYSGLKFWKKHLRLRKQGKTFMKFS